MEEKAWTGKELADGFRRLADWFEKQENLKREYPGQGVEVILGLKDTDAIEEALTLGGNNDYETRLEPLGHTVAGFGAVRSDEWRVYRRPVALRLYSVGDVDGD